MSKIALAIHGGAGTILKSRMTVELENEYRAGLRAALDAGWTILQRGGTALDAAEVAVVALEDNALFNAGRGAVFTHNGRNEMDASIMDGANHNAGAVAFVRNVKNPIRLARLVMKETEHILLAGDGANEFARQMRVDFADDEYFFTDFRYRQLLEARELGKIQLDHTADEPEMIEESVHQKPQVLSHEFEIQSSNLEDERKTHQSLIQDPKSKIQNPIGTVGAVACDARGNLAAATSTGGMTNKKYGRIGDTPLVGAGTYADNRTCAVSCTGHGEFFMLTAAAYDVAARMKYKNSGLIEAARETVDYLRDIGGEGGLIAVDRFGNVALPFNSEGMYRGFVNSDGEIIVEIYR